MKRILFVHQYNDYSGSPKVLSNVIESLSDSYSVHLLTSKGGEGFLSKFAKSASYFKYRPCVNKFKTLLIYLISQVVIFLFVCRNRSRFDIIYVNTLLPFGASLAAKLCRLTLVYHVHETYVRPKILYFFLRFVCKSFSDVVICVSKYLAAEYETVEHKCKILFNCLDDVDNSASLNEIQCNGSSNASEKFVVTLVCSLKVYKGVNQFFSIAETFSEVSEHECYHFILQLNSNQQSFDDYLTKNSLTVPKNLEVRFSSSNLRPLYSNSSLVLNLSLPDMCVETFGMTIIEAFSFGKPVIVPPLGGPAELVDGRGVGFLIDSNDIGLIRETIVKVSTDKVLYESLSSNAKCYSTLFSKDNFSSQLKSIFSSF